MKKNIEIVKYDSKWPEIFESENFFIQKAVGNNCLAIKILEKL